MTGSKRSLRMRRMAVAVVAVLVMAAGLVALGDPDFQRQVGLSTAAATALSIMLVAAVLWITELIPLFVTSLVVLFLNVVWLTPVLKVDDPGFSSGAFTAPFFSNVIMLFLGGFVLSSGFRKFRVDERIAQAVLQRTGTEPARVLLGMMLVTAFLSMWMSNTATTAMMLGIAISLLEKLPAGDPFRKAIIIGIPFSANLGGLGTPIGSPPNAIALQYMAQLQVAPSFAGWIAMALPVLALGLMGTWLLLLKLFPPAVKQLEATTESGFRWSRRSILVVTVTVLTALGWLTTDLHHMPSGVVALIPVIVFFGARLLEVGDFRALSWDVLILAGGGLSLGAAVEASELGRWFVSFVPTDTVGLMGIVAMIALLSVVMSSVMSNTATANLIIPVVVGISGLPIDPLLMAVAYACSLAMALPVSTPPNAMAFGTGTLQAKDMLGPGVVVSAAGILLTCTLALWWWDLLGLY